MLDAERCYACSAIWPLLLQRPAPPTAREQAACELATDTISASRASRSGTPPAISCLTAVLLTSVRLSMIGYL